MHRQLNSAMWEVVIELAPPLLPGGCIPVIASNAQLLLPATIIGDRKVTTRYVIGAFGRKLHRDHCVPQQPADT